MELRTSLILSDSWLVYANAARRDAGFFNVFYCVHTFCGLSGWGGWGDVNVPWKRYVTYAGVGVGGWGDVNVPWKRYVTYAGVGVGGWGDVNVPWKRYVTYAGVGVGGVG